jgi:hypothetical protein
MHGRKITRKMGIDHSLKEYRVRDRDALNRPAQYLYQTRAHSSQGRAVWGMGDAI